MTEEQRQKNREYQKKWRGANKEKLRKYRKARKEQIREYQKQWREANKEYRKQWYEANKERVSEYQKQWREANKEYNKEYYEKNKLTKRGKVAYMVSNYKRLDEEKGYSTDQNIDGKWIFDNILNSSCIYCGETDWRLLGADRIDNSKPHTPDNCVCACGLCNTVKSDRFTFEEFKEYRKSHPKDLSGNNPYPIIEKDGVRALGKKPVR